MPFFFFVGVLFAVADWVATAREARSLRWITKPGTILALLLWFATTAPASDNPQILWFTLALCFSLIGDIFLHMEGYHLVKGGLAFLLAQITFTIAYNTPFQVPPITSLIFIVNIILTVVFFREIIKTIRDMGDNELAIGVGFYALALTSMTSSAISTLFRPAWPAIGAWPTAIGASLFFASDILLFYKFFFETKKRVKILTIITYHLAQFSLTYGFLWYLYG